MRIGSSKDLEDQTLTALGKISAASEWRGVDGADAQAAKLRALHRLMRQAEDCDADALVADDDGRRAERAFDGDLPVAAQVEFGDELAVLHDNGLVGGAALPGKRKGGGADGEAEEDGQPVSGPDENQPAHAKAYPEGSSRCRTRTRTRSAKRRPSHSAK